MVRVSTAALLVLGACTMGPDFEVPEVDVPDQFLEVAPDGESVANMPWWELFEDQQLRELIEIALEENLEVGIALERIEEARATLGFVRTEQLPSFTYGAGASRADPGDNFLFGVAGPNNAWTLGGNVFFEVDLWGKLRRATESARAELLATEAAYVATTITLVADVAETYLLLLDLDERLEISERTLQARREATRIIRDRFREGVVSNLDVNQAEIEEVEAEVAVYRIQRSIAQAEHAMRVLLGRNPGRIARGSDLANQIRPEVPVGLPSELLQRRPDIKLAEHVAHAQTARIGVAKGLMFPSLQLTGALGLAAVDYNDLFDASSKFWSIGADLTGPLFEFGRNQRRVEVEESRTRQAILDYERIVLQAFREVEDALVAIRTFRLEYEARTRQVESATEAARLARALYDEEFTDYIDVLDAERSQFRAELAQSVAHRASLQAVVQLYRALGGGWMSGDEEIAEATAEEEDS